MNMIRHTLKTLIGCMLLIVLFAGQISAQVIRKNIDSLTAVELATYEHAIQLLKDRSAENPYDLQGYAWQAWVHNKNRVTIPAQNTMKQGDMIPTEFYKKAAQEVYADGTYGYPGMCEHGKDIFFIWHRAQFYYYEQILQNTDPEGTIVDSKGNKYPTKNLGIPFWNFTRKASGKKFPKIFEDQNSVLYHPGRNVEIDPEDTSFTSPYLLSNLLQSDYWAVFGGYPNATNGGYGTFESQIHNPMHDKFIGGDMASPSTAAYDPIFYSFHAYIDYVFEAWMEQHGKEKITSLNYFLRAQQPEQFHLPNHNPGLGDRPNMGQANLYLDISKLGYKYQVRGKDRFYNAAEIAQFLTDSKGRPLVLGVSNESTYYKLFTYGVQRKPESDIGELTQQTLTIDAVNPEVPYIYTYTESQPTTSYQVDIYMHPVNVKAKIKSKKFREKYFVRSANAWLDEMHGDHIMGGHKLNVDLTEAINALNQNFSGEEYQITVNYTKQ